MSKLKNYHYEDPLECRLNILKQYITAKKLLYNLATWYHKITFNNVKCNTTSQMQAALSCGLFSLKLNDTAIPFWKQRKTFKCEV